MRGQIAARSEIAGAVYNAASKMPLPDAIDDHARSERIVPIGDRVGQIQTPAAMREWPLGVIQRGEEMRRSFGSRIVRISANKYMRWDKFGRLLRWPSPVG